MAIIITEPKLEEPLEKHAKRQAVPTTKGRLLRAIARSMLAVADSEGVHIGQLIDELNVRAAQRKTRAAG